MINLEAKNELNKQIDDCDEEQINDLQIVANRLGGIERIVQWVEESKDNERIFWIAYFNRSKGGG